MDKEHKNINYHLDKNILIFFGVALLFFSALSFTKYVNYEPCMPVKFQIIAKQKRAGELIKFVDYSLGAEEWEWNFGDSTIVKTEKTPYHVFKKPGKYTVNLLVNGRCEINKVIIIGEKIVLLDSTKLPVFEVPDEIIVGEKLVAIDNTDRAKEWEWRFGETVTIDSYKRKAEYIYTEPGIKTISLVINGDLKHVGKRKIKVVPKPKVKKPKDVITKKTEVDPEVTYKPPFGEEDAFDGSVIKKPEIPYISEENFADLLIKISNKEEVATVFEKYMCGKLNITIDTNKGKINFLKFCKKISGRRPVKIKKLELIREPDSNCIKNIIINYSRPFF